MTASMVFGGPTRLTLMTGTCSLASHPKASATASTAPPVGRPQNTSAAYRAEPGAAPWKALARPTMSEATAVPCSAGTAMPQPCCWIVMPLNTSCVTSTPLSMRPMRVALHREPRGGGGLERGGARGERQHLAAHHRRAVRVGLEHVTVPAQELSDPERAQLAQAARIRLARERRGRLLDVERHARRKIRQHDGRQLRQPQRRQRHLRGGRRGDHEQRCQNKPAHGSTIVERGPAGKKWKKMASMNVGPA